MRFARITYTLLIILLLVGCNSAKLSTADAEFKRGEYFKAADTYRKVYNKTSSTKERELRGRIAYSMATCYRLINYTPRAIASYRNAIRYEYGDSTSYLYLAKEQQKSGKYADAIVNYKHYLDIMPGDREAKIGLKSCEFALAQKENPTRYVIKREAIFNSRRSECVPRFLPDDYNTIYFSSTSDKATGKDKSLVTGLKQSDIFFTTRDEKGNWLRPEPAEGAINTGADEGIISFSPEGDIMYYTVASVELGTDSKVSIYTSERADASWGEGSMLAITADTTAIYAHPAVSKDGKWLYFVSDLLGGYGGKDIWRINLEDMETIDNLGPDINTPDDEMFPYVDTRGDLYFSSNGHVGLGGLDIYYAYSDDDENWTVRNMGAPINSSADDFGFLRQSQTKGYLSSNRNDARGYDHIYSYELPVIEVKIEGYVLDGEGYELPGAIIRIVGRDGTNIKEYAKDDGSFSFTLNLATDYVMMAGYGGYLNSSAELTTLSELQNETYYVEFLLASMGKPVPVDNIFFDFNKATIRDESETSLSELIKTLNDNPHISIELGAHTDVVGSPQYNQLLSQRRAESVVAYLVSKGIDASKLTAKGYGESVPLVVTKKMAEAYPQFTENTILNEEYINTLSPEDQDIVNSMSRRTEFRVIAIESGLF